MATAKKEDAITIEEQTIITQKMTIDPALFKSGSDSTFQLKPGHYRIELNIHDAPYGCRTQIRNITASVICAMSTNARLHDTFKAEDGNDYRIEYFTNRNWEPIQSLPSSTYTCTLTYLKK